MNTRNVKAKRVLAVDYIEDSLGSHVVLLMDDGSVHEGFGLTGDMTLYDVYNHNYAVWSYNSESDYNASKPKGLNKN